LLIGKGYRGPLYLPGDRIARRDHALWMSEFKAETCAVLTNTIGYGPMNGFGDPEVIYTLERLVDMAAEKLTWIRSPSDLKTACDTGIGRWNTNRCYMALSNGGYSAQI